MDTNWPHRGSKLFLPKIEYTRLTSSTTKLPEWSSNTVGSESVVNESVDRESNNERNGSKSQEFLLEKQANDRPTGTSFTKFAVLPPIQRHLHRKHYKKIRSVENEQKPSDERELEIRRKGIFLRRQTALLAGERDKVTRSHSEDLKVFGQRCTRNYQQPNLNKDQNGFLKISRPPDSPDVASVFDRVNESVQLTELGYNRVSGNDYSHTQTRSPKFKRFNSDSTFSNDKLYRNKARSVQSEGSLSISSLLSPFDIEKKVTREGLSVDITPGSRPISRCHIDINMNETDPSFNQEATESEEIPSAPNNTVQNTECEQNPASSAQPLVQISTGDLSRSSGYNPSENSKPPSIQILIDTLDSAKNEIPDKLELPKMSVREQRRRSALCRVNSKQIDDFLLVHNLKDLGLL